MKAEVLEGTPDPDDYVANSVGIIELELYANSTPPAFGEQAIGGMALRAFPEG